MDPTTEAAAGGSEQTSVVIPAAPAPEGDRGINAHEAGRLLATWRHKRNEQSTAEQSAEQAGKSAERAAPAEAAPAAETESAEATAEAGTGEPETASPQ